MTPGEIDEKPRGGKKFLSWTEVIRRVEDGEERNMAECHVTVES